MEKPASIANRSYEDFDPVSKLRREESRDTIELHLPGFRREHIRIHINHLGFLVISGERSLGGTRWRRFKKEIELSTYCNVDAIHANFTESILSVVMPKKIPPKPIHQEKQERQIPELEQVKEKEKKKESYQNLESGGGGTTEDTETTTKEALEDSDTTDYQIVEKDHVELTQETTREIALKFMVVIIVILVIASYLADMSKSLMAQAQSYFHN